MATIQELSNLHPDGTRLGQSSSDLIAFLGGTPRAQYSFSATGGTLSISSQRFSSDGASANGFSSSAQFNALRDAVRDMRALLVAFGLGA